MSYNKAVKSHSIGLPYMGKKSKTWNSVCLGRSTVYRLLRLDWFIQGFFLTLGNILQVSNRQSHSQVINPEGKFLVDISTRVRKSGTLCHCSLT